MTFHVPEKFRVKTGLYGSDASFGNCGQFVIQPVKFKTTLMTQASDQMGWEHVSVSTPSRCPTWEEMSYIKSLFWDNEDCVIQYHPPKTEYINNHKFCLHLWRPVDQFIPVPPSILVGIKS